MFREKICMIDGTGRERTFSKSPFTYNGENFVAMVTVNYAMQGHNFLDFERCS